MFIYGFENLCNEINQLKSVSTARVFAIGRSVCGRELFCIKCGYGERKVLINGAHHGGESITSAMLMRFAKEITSKACYNKLLDKSSIYIVPMVNPDGVELVKNGCDGFFNRNFLLKINGSSDFTHWQANAGGVDLNHNYNAGWDIAKRMETEQGITGPCATRFGGYTPESEPETKAMTILSLHEKFDISISYHTQGREIYYKYRDYTPCSSKALAEMFSSMSGYTVSEPEGIAAFGGYKDWFIETFSKPSFTIEAGLGENPLPFEQLDEIYEDNRRLLAVAAFG